MTTHAKCEHCRATGRDPAQRSVFWRTPYRCNACRGSGRGTRDPLLPSFMPAPACAECEGIGLRPSARCPVCRGRGAGPAAELDARRLVALAAVAVRCAKFNHSSWDREHGRACHKSGSEPACVACEFAAPATAGGSDG